MAAEFAVAWSGELERKGLCPSLLGEGYPRITDRFLMEGLTGERVKLLKRHCSALDPKPEKSRCWCGRVKSERARTCARHKKQVMR